MPHGVLFIAYIILAFLIKSEMKWNIKTLAIVLIASVLPFGTFYIEGRYFKKKN
jgi:integral membrane protein